jgi:succinate dehydrogenase/fumarate reductase flavoprotein subunit
MAGLAAAATAAEAGAAVTVFEKGAAPGGSAALSGGLLWTEPTFERLRERIPQGDPELGRALIDGYPDAVNWLLADGVELTERLKGLFGTGEGHRIQPDMRSFVTRMVARVERAGGAVRCGAAVDDLELDDRAAVRRVRVRTAEGFEHHEAPAVVLCTGGFPAGTELLSRYVSRYADRLYVRANPHSTGDGIDVAVRAGATTSRGMHTFYGHLLPAPPAKVTPENFILLTQYYSVHCVLVNRRGERFVDESEADEISAQALACEQDALGFLLLDDQLADEVTAPPAAAFPPMDRHGDIARAGGRILRADDLQTLAALIDDAGGNGWRTIQTLEEYNTLVAEHPERLRVPRAGRRLALTRPPFTAVPVTPAVTFTEGGLRIDPGARVIGRSGAPIPGLYAAGGDGGGVYHERYAGGLSLSLVFGRIAGASAARQIAEAPR